MLIALNTLLARLRRRLAVVVAALALIGLVVVAHSALSGDHMGDAAVACVAVAETAALGIAAAAASTRPATLRAQKNADHVAAPPQPPAGAPLPRVRAGPPSLQVFRL